VFKNENESIEKEPERASKPVATNESSEPPPAGLITPVVSVKVWPATTSAVIKAIVVYLLEIDFKL
jgi:hypothetical protein